MEITKNKNSLTATMTPEELWFLSQTHAPGIVFGLENPFKGLNDEEVSKKEESVILELLKSGILQKGEGQTLHVDEYISGMVYSCMHSEHMLVINSLISKQEAYVHLLPGWQLLIQFSGGSSKLTTYLNPETMFKDLQVNYFNKLTKSKIGVPIITKANELELAIFLFQSGKTADAFQIISERNEIKTDDAAKFLNEFLNYVVDVQFNIILNHNSLDKISQYWFKIFTGTTQSFWVTKIMSAIDGEEYLKWEPLSEFDIRANFLEILPKF